MHKYYTWGCDGKWLKKKSWVSSNFLIKRNKEKEMIS